MNFLDPGQLRDSGFFILKIASVVLLALYFVYAFIIVRQVNLMTQTIDVAFKKPLKVFAALHLIYALLVLLYAIIM
ncbi:MAG: hypothetical protein UT39_C0009G0009 [Candidatus Woesebacteria bacterium GW2011_GWA1_39_21]|uniref:Uncharacterized protein n=1 Tax=Candidatus Woesebacteria bacterium GW2011_GWA1_39_21 TaxID=1618550 RepID=A0A0G0N4Y3_9BACT|nr:MAG: hypothetical protein UT39_C0009G0009 [Candidatus Woesebacteria bacterium GW2011_GWA1_39_21]